MTESEHNDNNQVNGGGSILRNRQKNGVATPPLFDEDEDAQTVGSSNAKMPTSRPGLVVADKKLTEKLFSSKEERQFVIPHIHKILGFSCLASFVYRMAYIGPSDGNFGPTLGTLVFVVHHFLLNASSFMFAIPQRRIRDGGYRIWPEYRFHSLVFAWRSLAFILLRSYEESQGIPPDSPNCYYHLDLLIVLATCAFADLGSYLQGPYRSNTVRGVTFSDPFETYFASEMQIFLTSFYLIGYRRYTMSLVSLATIQINSFLMTLRRKNVASQSLLTAFYTLMLVAGFVTMIVDEQYIDRALVGASFGSIATILRMGLRVNKYLLWTGLGLCWHFIRTREMLPFHNDWVWVWCFCVGNVVANLIGVYKRNQAPKESRSALVGHTIFWGNVALYGYMYIAAPPSVLPLAS